MSSMKALTKGKAIQVITALRKGTPPDEGAGLYSVGREELLSYFDKKLLEVKKHAVSDIKFVSADWGHGKSHFLDLLSDLALKHNFVVSEVELRSGEVSFDELSLVVERMMASVITPRAKANGLEAILNEWSQLNASKSKQELYESLLDAGIFPDMRLKLVEYASSYNCPNGPEYERCLQIMKWFEGKETKSKTFRSATEFIRNFVLLVRLLGYSGLVILLDEAEAIVSLSRIGKRDQANENVRQIIDNDNAVHNFYLVFASTPSFLSGEDDRGAQSYPALWRRISDPLQEFVLNSVDKVIVELPELSEEQFTQIAVRIRTIYGKATGKTPSTITDEHLRLLAHYVKTQKDKSVGTMVRSTVAVLEQCTRPQFNFLETFELIVEKAMQQEARDRTT